MYLGTFHHRIQMCVHICMLHLMKPAFHHFFYFRFTLLFSSSVSVRIKKFIGSSLTHEGLFFSFLLLLLFKRGGVCLLVMAPPCLLMVLMVVAMATGTRSASEENELDYGYWNYREGGKS